MPPVGSWPGGLVTDSRAVAAVVAGGPHGDDALGGQRPLQLHGGGVRVELAAADRAVGVVRDLDRRALRGGDARAARRLVVLEHPVQRGVGADDEQHGAGGDRDQAGAGGGALRAACRRTAWSAGRRRCRSRACRGRRRRSCRCRRRSAPRRRSRCWSSDSSRQTLLRLATTALLPSSFWNEGWVGSTPESMTATETPLPSSAEPFAPVKVLAASAPRVAVVRGLVVELDRGVALEVGHARLGAGGLDLVGGAGGDDDADPLELGDRAHARGVDGGAGGRDVGAVHHQRGRRGAGQGGQLAGQEVLDGGRGRRGCGRGRSERADDDGPAHHPERSADRPVHGTPRGVTATWITRCLRC